LKANDIILAKIQSLNHNGEGVFKTKDITIFVPRGVPGDTLKVKVKKLRKNYGSGEIIAIVKPSPLRVNPECKAFENGCGGCQWLHIDYKTQLLWKARIVNKILGVALNENIKVLPCLGMKEPYHYRNKLSLNREDSKNSKKLGLMKENSLEIVEFDYCKQELESNQKAYEIIRKQRIPFSITQIHVRSNQKGETGIYFYAPTNTKTISNFSKELLQKIKDLKGVGLSTHNDYYHLVGEKVIKEDIGDLNYLIPINGFFQTNYTQAQQLQEIVFDLLKPTKKDKILDLYCGAGFFSLFLAKEVESVYGIENNSSSIESAIRNAKINNITNANFVCADVKEEIVSFRKKSIDCIILDPPRVGSEIEVLDEIVKMKPKKIIYISCSPQSLARDLKSLSHLYKITFCKPVDMFPHTYHIEVVVKLELNASDSHKKMEVKKAEVKKTPIIIKKNFDLKKVKNIKPKENKKIILKKSKNKEKT